MVRMLRMFRMMEDYDLCDLDLTKLKEHANNGEIFMLEYLEKFIPKDKKDLFDTVMDYNEIYCNGWNLNDLFEMGKEDNYWTERANRFIKKYNIKKEDYDEDLFEQYATYRDELLEELGLRDYVLEENLKFDKDGLEESELITPLKDLEDKKYSYTIARIMNFNHSIELHYNEGKTWLEYGTRLDYDYWENEIVDVTWFDKNMSEDKMWDYLDNIFKKYKENNYCIPDKELDL